MIDVLIETPPTFVSSLVSNSNLNEIGLTCSIFVRDMKEFSLTYSSNISRSALEYLAILLCTSPYWFISVRTISKNIFKSVAVLPAPISRASLLGPSNKGSISSIGPLSLIFGTSINYAIYHQSDKARFKIPLRKMLFIGPESTFANDEQKGRLTRWLNILNDYVLKKLKTEYPES